MAIAKNYRLYPHAMALQLVLPLGRFKWQTSRPTTRLGRAFRAGMTRAAKAAAALPFAARKELAGIVANVVPQWVKDARSRAQALAKVVKAAQMAINFATDVLEAKLPKVGEMFQGKKMTVAMHRRLTVLQIIKSEETSGDAKLIEYAAWRRKCLKLAPGAPLV